MLLFTLLICGNVKAYELPEPKEPCYVAWPNVPFIGPEIICHTFDECPECLYCFEYYHRLVPITDKSEVQITQITAIGNNCSSMNCRYYDLFQKGLVLIYNANQMGWDKNCSGVNIDWAGTTPGVCMRRLVAPNQEVLPDDVFFDGPVNGIKLDYETEYLLNNPNHDWSWHIFACDNTTCCSGYFKVYWGQNCRLTKIEYQSWDNYPTNCLPLGVCFPACDVVKFSKDSLEKIYLGGYDYAGINIYPNPAKTFINIEFSNPIKENFWIEIYDLNNKLIEKIMVNPVSQQHNSIVDISKLSNGTYFIRITTPDYENMTKKFIKE